MTLQVDQALPPSFGDRISVIRGQVWAEYKKTGKAGKRYPYFRWREVDSEGKITKRSKYRKGLPPILNQQAYDNWKEQNAKIREAKEQANDKRRNSPVHKLAV